MMVVLSVNPCRRAMWWMLCVTIVIQMSMTVVVVGQGMPNRALRYSDCSVDDYYLGEDPTTWTRDRVRELLTTTHRTELPAVVGNETITDALIDLYPGAPDPETGRNDTVYLIYRTDSVPAKPANTPESWRREDLWPVERGVARDSPALTDVHVKAPVDWSVNEIRGSLSYGICGTVESFESCVSPANEETAFDTAYDGKIFTPPPVSRGDIARAIFYNALRYETELGLVVKDCPPFGPTDFGYLSELLRWHQQDPVSQEELDRNERACAYWQGNRNIFVDYPVLVEAYFTTPPDSILEGTFLYSRCVEATNAPTAEPNECSALQPGIVSMFAFNSQTPDELVLFPLDDIPPEVGSIYVTDNAWDGTSLRTNEGTLEFRIGSQGLRAGVAFGHDVDLGFPNGVAQVIETGNFDLGDRGDTILVYCLNADGFPHFLYGLSYSGEWAASGLENYAADESALPDQLSAGDVGEVSLVFFPSYAYTGQRFGTQAFLLSSFSNASNWQGSLIRIQFSAAVSVSTTFSIAAVACLATTVLLWL